MNAHILRAASALVAGALLAAPATAQSLVGYTIAMKITTDSGPQPISLTLRAAGAKLRVEMDGIPGLGGGGGGGGLGAMAGGLYIIPQDSSKVAVVLPAMGMGIAMDMSMMANVAGGARGGRNAGGGAGGGGGRGGRTRGGQGGANGAGTAEMGVALGSIPQVTDVTTAVEDLGAGEAILGHPTHKYRIKSSYTMDGEKQTETSDTWFATDLSGSDEAFAKFFSTFGAVLGGGNSSQSVTSAVRAKMPKGFPLRVIRKSDSPSGVTTTTIDATEVTRNSFDAADFEVPAGIQLMDAGMMMGGRRGGL